MIFPWLCLTSISDLCPTGVVFFTQSQCPLFFQCSLCLLAYKVLVSSLPTPYYLFLCFIYNPKTMCDTLRSFLQSLVFPLISSVLQSPVSPFLGFCQTLSTPPHLSGFFYSWQMHLSPKWCLQRLLLPPSYLNYTKKKKVASEQDSAPPSQR